MTQFITPVTLVLLCGVLMGCQPPRAGSAAGGQVAEAGRSEPSGEARAGNPHTGDLAEALNEFATKLYGIVGDSDRNSFFSPLSIYTALSMTSTGAAGETRSEMDSILLPNGRSGSSLEPEDLPGAIHVLFESLKEATDNDEVILEIANALWVQQNFRIKDQFSSLLERQFNAGPTSLDFVDRLDESRGQINLWTAQKTGGKIDPLLPPGSLDEDTRLVLTNAVYFLGNWQEPFDDRATGVGEFSRLTGDTVQTLFMHRTGTYRFEMAEDGTVLELPYRGDRLAMAIFLPARMDDFKEISSRMNPRWLRERLSGLQSSRAAVAMPMFRIESKTELSSALSRMGMPRAFRPGEAQFSGISDEADLFIQKVFHGAFVEVNERGTEAAAATGVSMGITSMPPSIHIDHPFLFWIHDRKTGAILFMGHVVDPTAG